MDRIKKIKAFPGDGKWLNTCTFNILREYELILTFVLGVRYSLSIYRFAC